MERMHEEEDTRREHHAQDASPRRQEGAPLADSSGIRVRGLGVWVAYRVL